MKILHAISRVRDRHCFVKTMKTMCDTNMCSPNYWQIMYVSGNSLNKCLSKSSKDNKDLNTKDKKI